MDPAIDWLIAMPEIPLLKKEGMFFTFVRYWSVSKKNENDAAKMMKSGYITN